MPAVAVLIAGLQVPLMPLIEVIGNTGATAPTHTAGIAAKVGVVRAVTVMLNVAVVAQRPAVGVNVYMVIPAVVVLTAGLQVPVMPLVEVVGNTGAAAPAQTAGIAAKIGVIGAVTVMLNVVFVAHCPVVGVNV